jgi:methylmalonyl-CoA mutase cobalamin-binding subunit
LKQAEEIGSRATHTEEVFEMATDKKFTVAGISKLEGNYKVRFANDMMRIKVLAKSGHEDIRLADLEGEYTKVEAAKILLGLEDFSDAMAQSTIAEYLEDNTPKAKVSKPVAKAAKTPATKVAKAPAKAAVTEDEDAPF